MAVLTAPIAPLAPALPQAAGPSRNLQRSGTLWQLGIEAQELTTAIGQLAEQLETDDDDSRAQALTELEAALLSEEGNKQALAAKADATCWVIEHLRGQAAYRQQQVKRLTKLSRYDATRADALVESLVFVLTQLQPTANRFSFPNHELTSRKSQAVEIDDEDSMPSQWVTLKTTSQPDKTAIKEALKALVTSSPPAPNSSYAAPSSYGASTISRPSARCVASAGGALAGQTQNTPFDRTVFHATAFVSFDLHAGKRESRVKINRGLLRFHIQ
jgi:hypothetical protein